MKPELLVIGKQSIGVTCSLPPDLAVSQETFEIQISQSNYLNNRILFRSKSRGVTGAFMSCFICGKPAKGAEYEDSISRSNSVSSFAASRTSTMSSSTHSQLRYSHSYSRYDTRKETIREETTVFSVAEIYAATRNFSRENIIGQGGFGTVYKGKLKDGSLVAVKRAKKNLYNQLSAEFKSEVHTLSKVEHLNLVRFLGWVENDDEQIILLEYVGNGTLREHLHGIQGDLLEIAQRLDIAIDVAHAITYLHMYTDHPIIHRDIKASNILLTEKLRAKVTDFGSARLASDDMDATHISTCVKGSAGYIDPEYLQTYQLTDKSDVYSFGVLLVELITGRHPIERKRDPKERNTTRWAIKKAKEEGVVLVMDPRLRRNPAAIVAAESMMVLAAECLAPTRRSRPPMKKCAEALWKIRKEFREMQFSSSNANNEVLKRKEFR